MLWGARQGHATLARQQQPKGEAGEIDNAFGPRQRKFRWHPMTIRGGGDPNPRMAFRPPCRMGPPLRSSAADANYCIMVQIPRIYRIQVCGAMLRAQLASPPQIVPNSETQHHTREQSEVPRLTLDGKIPIQIMSHGAAAAGFDRQTG